MTLTIDTAKVIDAPVLEINAPEWFKDPAFMKGVRSGTVMSWHHPDQEEPDEFSDTIVFVDPSLNGEGSDTDEIPEKYWNKIMDVCRQHFQPDGSSYHILVRITNMS